MSPFPKQVPQNTIERVVKPIIRDLYMIQTTDEFTNAVNSGKLEIQELLIVRKRN